MRDLLYNILTKRFKEGKSYGKDLPTVAQRLDGQ